MDRAVIDQLSRDGERLIAAFQGVIRALPASARGIGPMARYLGLHKGTCQRVVEGAQGSRDGLHAYARFPGVAALRTYLDACGRVGLPDEDLGGARAAVDRLDAALDRLDVSQRGLLDLIAATGEGRRDSAVYENRALVERRSLYSAARRVTGESVEAKVVIGLVMPSPVRQGRLRLVVVSSLRGIVRQPYARPVVPFVLTGPSVLPIMPGDREQTDAADAPTFEVLRGFSTAGVRAVPLTSGRQDRTLLVVDTDHLPEGDRDGVDTTVQFIADAPLDPRANPGVRLAPAARITQPTRALIHELHVHRDLDLTRPPRVGCFALCAPPGDAEGGGYEECWYERFPEAPPVEPLDAPGPRRVRTDPLARFAGDLSGHIFDSQALDRRRFISWRCRVPYPLWQTEYRAYLG